MSDKISGKESAPAQKEVQKIATTH